MVSTGRVRPFRSNLALLLVDLQRDFLEPGGRLHVSRGEAARVLAVARQLLARAEAEEWVTAFIRSEFPPGDRVSNFLRRNAALEGAPGSALDPRLTVPEWASVFAKARPDAFTTTNFGAFLKRHSIHDLIIAGVMTDGCVLATARTALRRGYHVFVVQDGVASRNPLRQRYGLLRLKWAGAKVVPFTDLVVSNVDQG